MFKQYQIVKVKDQISKNLYRYGGKHEVSPTLTMYDIMDFKNKTKLVGRICNADDFLKPTVQDLIDYVDSINLGENIKNIPSIEIVYSSNRINNERNIAIIMTRQYLDSIINYIEPRVHKVYNISSSPKVAVVITKSIMMWKPEVMVVSADLLDIGIPTIDFEDIDTADIIKRNTISFSGIDGEFASKELEISNINFSQQLFDNRTCEIEMLSDFSIFKALGCLNPNIVGHIKLSDGTAYEVSEIAQMNQMDSGGKFKTELRFKNWKPVISYSTINDSDISGFDLHATIRKKAVDDLAYQIDSEICKSLGIDFGNGKDNTATAMVESEQLKRRQYEAFKQTVKYAADKVYEQSKQVPSYCDYSWYGHRFWNMPVFLKDSVIRVEVPADKKDANDLTKEELKEVLQKANKEKEVEKMKITENKDLTQIIIDEDRKTVTAIAEEHTALTKAFGLDARKRVTVAKASEKDEFDKYVGTALAIVYQLFGSKEEFHKFVRENELVNDIKKKKEAKEKAKAEREAIEEKAREKKAAKKAKEAEDKAREFEARQAKLDATMDIILDELAKRLTSKSKKTKTKKGE